jgi:hypothetical protein
VARDFDQVTHSGKCELDVERLVLGHGLNRLKGDSAFAYVQEHPSVVASEIDVHKLLVSLARRESPVAVPGGVFRG